MSRTRIQRHSRLRQLTYQLTLLAAIIMLYNLMWAHSRLTSSTSSSLPSSEHMMSSSSGSRIRSGFLNERLRRQRRKGIIATASSIIQQSASSSIPVLFSSAATTTNQAQEVHYDTDEDYENEDTVAYDCLPPIQRLSDIRSCAMKNKTTTTTAAAAASAADERHDNKNDDFWLYSMPEQCRQSLATWQDAQACLMGRRRYYDSSSSSSAIIKHVHIIGERNSGTKFVTREIQQCFATLSSSSSSQSTTSTTTNNSTTTTTFFPRIHRDFIRSKHFFQPILYEEDYSESLVIVVVRNPIDWIAAMRQHPYHAPCHLQGFNNSSTPATGGRNNEPVPLPWPDFLSKPWTMPRHGEPFDLLLRNHNDDPTAATIKTSRSRRNLQQKANRRRRRHRIATFQDFSSTTPYMDQYIIYNNNNNKNKNATLPDYVVEGVGGGCTERFQTNEVVPCVYDKNATHFVPAERLRGYEPLYELKRGGGGRKKWRTRKQSSPRKLLKPGVDEAAGEEDAHAGTTKDDNDNDAYTNILDLRADKIFNFVLELPLYMKLGGFLIVRYEDLLRHGTLPLLQQVARMVGQQGNGSNITILPGDEQQQQRQQQQQQVQEAALLPPQCRPTEPQPDRWLHRRAAAIPSQVRTWIEQNINVETERLLGYYSDAIHSLV